MVVSSLPRCVRVYSVFNRTNEVADQIRSISSYLHKTDSLRWTPQLYDCLRQLSEDPECPEDEVLVLCVRMQLVVEKAVLSDWYENVFESSPRFQATPLLLFQTAFAQLEEVKNSLPLHLRGYSKSPFKSK